MTAGCGRRLRAPPNLIDVETPGTGQSDDNASIVGVDPASGEKV